MAHRNAARTQRQVAAYHQRLLHAPGLPFSSVLDHQLAQRALDAEHVFFRNRIFTPLMWTAVGERREEIVRRVRQAAREHTVGDRPNRWEPRARKRRPKHYPHLNEPRQQARKRMESRRCA